MNNDKSINAPLEVEEYSTLLEFWAAYVPGENNKKNYLGDGKGNVRLFKTESALREFIEPRISQEDYARVIVHPVEGKFAIPEELPAEMSVPQELIIPQSLDGAMPIKTLAPITYPTALELLENTKKRRKRSGKKQ